MNYLHFILKQLKNGYKYPSCQIRCLNCTSKNLAKSLQALDLRFVKKDGEKLLEFAHDSRIIYNSLIESHSIKMSRLKERKLLKKLEIEREKELFRKESVAPAFLTHKLIENSNEDNSNLNKNQDINSDVSKSREFFPFIKTEKFEHQELEKEDDVPILKEPIIDWNPPELSIKDDIKSRLEKYKKGTLDTQVHFNPRVMVDDNKGFDYLMQYFDREQSVQNLLAERSVAYSNPNPNIPVSDVPCGGCGADLHCQDSALPGYVPAQRFVGFTKSQLKATLCQRCHYLRHHNMALNVRIEANDYISSLSPIKDDRALVIVMVDLLDMPSSIWPGLLNVLGTRRPVIVVGNKIDLLPPDGPDHQNYVLEALNTVVENTDLGQTNIVDTCLLSAVTGFGVEDLIDKVHRHWSNKGNIYLLGCTNVGKSTLFNALLGSDLCQSSAIDLIMRATTSPWPGTTLNMLKFPILSPTGYRLHQRLLRRNEQRSLEKDLKNIFPQQRKLTNETNVATLSGYVAHTFKKPALQEESKDPFSVTGNVVPSRIQLPRKGVDPSDPKYINCKWCFDTPGSVSTEQILNMLTHEEVMKLVTKDMIIPRTFSLFNCQSLFIGGVARVDLLYSDQKHVCFTVFASRDLPITVVNTVHASALYREYLDKDLFEVPCGSRERLQRWPALKPKSLRVVGKGDVECSCDITLSTTGWVSVTGKRREDVDLRVWTPNGIGINVRETSMLPRTINLKGRKGKYYRGPAFGEHAVYVPELKLRSLHWMLDHESAK